jgi:hypothetical protein
MDFKLWLEYNWEQVFGTEMANRAAAKMRELRSEFAVIEGFGNLKKIEVAKFKDKRDAEQYATEHEAQTREKLRSKPDLLKLYWVRVEMISPDDQSR